MRFVNGLAELALRGGYGSVCAASQRRRPPRCARRCKLSCSAAQLSKRSCPKMRRHCHGHGRSRRITVASRSPRHDACITCTSRLLSGCHRNGRASAVAGAVMHFMHIYSPTPPKAQLLALCGCFLFISTQTLFVWRRATRDILISVNLGSLYHLLASPMSL